MEKLKQIHRQHQTQKTFRSKLLVLSVMAILLTGCPNGSPVASNEYSKKDMKDSTSSIENIDKHADSAKATVSSTSDGIKEANKNISKSAIDIKSSTKESETKNNAETIINNSLTISEKVTELSKVNNELDSIKTENSKLKQDIESNKKIVEEKDSRISALDSKIKEQEQQIAKANEKHANDMRWLLILIKGSIMLIGTGLAVFSFWKAIKTASPGDSIGVIIGLGLIGLGMFLETAAIYALLGSLAFLLVFAGYWVYKSIKSGTIAVDLIKSTQKGKSVLPEEQKNKFTDALYEAQDFETMKFVEKVKKEI